MTLPILSDRIRVEITRFGGQKLVRIPIVCEGSKDSDKILFIFDTGAYITIINRELYEWYKLDKLPRTDATISSYSGKINGYAFQIPGLIIGQKLLTGVWAFSPISRKARQNLIGNNVIDYFLPFLDNLNDCIYFPANPRPNPYVHTETNFSLACDGIMTVGEPS